MANTHTHIPGVKISQLRQQSYMLSIDGRIKVTKNLMLDILENLNTCFLGKYMCNLKFNNPLTILKPKENGNIRQ